MNKRVKKVLISEEEIAAKVSEIAVLINHDYREHENGLVLVGLLKGSFMFVADLVKKLSVPVVVDFMSVSSYRDGTTSTDVTINKDLDESITGKDVLLVEDIIDTGKTFSKVITLLKNRHPNTLKAVALLNKPCRRQIEVHLDYPSIEIPDEFVVGYGLDYAQFFRGLPHIAILEDK